MLPVGGPVHSYPASGRLLDGGEKKVSEEADVRLASRQGLALYYAPQHAHDFLEIEHGCQKLAFLGFALHECTELVQIGQQLGGILQVGSGLPDSGVASPRVASRLEVDDLRFQTSVPRHIRNF